MANHLKSGIMIDEFTTRGTVHVSAITDTNFDKLDLHPPKATVSFSSRKI